MVKDLTGHKINALAVIHYDAFTPFLSAAVSSSGELYTWGRGNYGRLGHGCSEDHKVPTLVAGLKGVCKSNCSCMRFEFCKVVKIHIVVL
jgi:alpha-tubulin suppressor-like RCC1 family protein